MTANDDVIYFLDKSAALVINISVYGNSRAGVTPALLSINCRTSSLVKTHGHETLIYLNTKAYQSHSFIHLSSSRRRFTTMDIHILPISQLLYMSAALV